MQEEQEYCDLEERKPRKKKPYFTYLVAGITVLLFLYSNIVQESLYTTWSASNMDIFLGKEWYRLITSMFLHGDINHLISNMLLFVCLGDLLERKAGSIRFGIIYFVSGIVGNLGSQGLSYARQEITVSIGASGGVFGLVGLLLCMVLLHRGKMEEVTLPRVILMIVLSLYSGFQGSGIDNTAHVIGLMAGFLCSFLIVSRKVLKESTSKGVADED